MFPQNVNVQQYHYLHIFSSTGTFWMIHWRKGQRCHKIIENHPYGSRTSLSLSVSVIFRHTQTDTQEKGHFAVMATEHCGGSTLGGLRCIWETEWGNKWRKKSWKEGGGMSGRRREIDGAGKERLRGRTPWPAWVLCQSGEEKWKDQEASNNGCERKWFAWQHCNKI